MARYTNFIGGGMSVCNINGRSISIINGEVYVDGVLYVPATEAEKEHKPFTPGKMIEHTFDVSSSFNSINSRGFIDVVFLQSDEDFELKGCLPENLIEKLDVHVENDTLYISMKSGYYDMVLSSDEAPTIYVTNKLLKDISTAGSGDFTINGDLSVPEGGFSYRNSGSGDFKAGKIKTNREISLTTSGSGGIEIEGADTTIFMAHISGSADVDCGEVHTRICAIEIKGSGDVRVSGKAEDVNFTIAGSGDIDAGNLKASTGKASVAGSGDIRCNVEHLSDRVRGSGDIHNRY